MSVKYAVRVLAVPLGTIEVASQEKKNQTTIQQYFFAFEFVQTIISQCVLIS